MIDNFCKENLHLAELKYFDMQHNGIEVTPPASFVVIYGVDGYYFNTLSSLEEFPTFERVPGTTNSYGDEYFGTKVRVLSESCSTGPCWLINDEVDIQDAFAGEVVTRSEIEQYVLDSPLYFKDRLDIAKDRLLKFEQPFKMARMVRKEREKIKEVDEFFRIRYNDRKREYIKTNRNW